MKQDRISDEEIDYRTRLADCIIKETKAKKDQIDLESKHRNLCRIDVALSEFNRHCTKQANTWRAVPDEMQAIVPTLSPEQYKSIQAFVNTQIEILYNDALHLTLTPLEEERAFEREKKQKQRAGAKDDE